MHWLMTRKLSSFEGFDCHILVVTNLGYFKAKVIFFIHFGENYSVGHFSRLLSHQCVLISGGPVINWQHPKITLMGQFKPLN